MLNIQAYFPRRDFAVEEIKSLGNDIYEVFGNRLTVKLKRIENGGYQVISVLGSYEPDDV